MLLAMQTLTIFAQTAQDFGYYQKIKTSAEDLQVVVSLSQAAN